MTMYDDRTRGGVIDPDRVHDRLECQTANAPRMNVTKGMAPSMGSLSRGPRATASNRPPISRAATQYYCAAFDCH